MKRMKTAVRYAMLVGKCQKLRGNRKEEARTSVLKKGNKYKKRVSLAMNPENFCSVRVTSRGIVLEPACFTQPRGYRGTSSFA